MVLSSGHVSTLCVRHVIMFAHKPVQPFQIGGQTCGPSGLVSFLGFCGLQRVDIRDEFCARGRA